MAIVYGRLSPYELDKQGGDPYIETGGRRYRIIELVVRQDGGANYQAKEVTAHEPEPASPQMPEPTPAVGIVDGAEVVHGPAPEPPSAQVSESPQSDAPQPEADKDDFEPPDFPPIIPSLPTWARRNGWAGTGRIPKAVRERYEAEFGVKE